jgi:methyl-accepting chemotaxis protein/methyl-accepting chemotaxis protein-1 (serine sensor receptor)
MSTRISLGTKLTIGFGAMLLFSCILSLGSLAALSGSKNRFDTAVNQTARKLELLGDIDASQKELFSDQRAVILYTFAKDAPHREQFRQEFDRDLAALRLALSALRPLLILERAKALTQTIETSLDQWMPAYQQLLALANADKPGEALTVSREKVLPLRDRISTAVNELIKIQQELLESDKASAAQNYSLCRFLSIAGLLLALLLGALVLFEVRRANRTLQHVATEIGTSSAQVSEASAQVASSSQSLAQGASEQAASLEETSASTEEITSMTRKNAENSQEVAKLMAETATKVDGANTALDQMVASMREIEGSSEKVSKIIKVIDEIAFQTNILALNAAVEAARAGEAGMGFAVVADEVRSLAQRSAQAAKDTAALIEESISHSKQGTTRLDQVAEAIRSITTSSGQVKMLVDEVSLGSQEQARGIEQIAKAVAQMQQVTQKTAANAEESASASEEMSAQAESMKAYIGELQLVVGAQEAKAAATSRAFGSKPAPRSASPEKRPLRPLSAPMTAKTAGKPEEFPLEGDFQEF